MHHLTVRIYSLPSLLLGFPSSSHSLYPINLWTPVKTIHRYRRNLTHFFQIIVKNQLYLATVPATKEIPPYSLLTRQICNKMSAFTTKMFNKVFPQNWCSACQYTHLPLRSQCIWLHTNRLKWLPLLVSFICSDLIEKDRWKLIPNRNCLYQAYVFRLV